MNYQKILQEAREAGLNAQKDIPDGYPCGGAYTVVRPARGPFIAYCKANNIGKKNLGGRGYTGWVLDGPGAPGKQNMYAAIASEDAFADVLRKYGINAYVRSYMD